MGGFLSRPNDDYESLLSLLESSIKEKESHLLSIKLRERRANALFITYGLAAWLGFTVLWYFHIIPRDGGSVLPVIGGPIAIIFTRKILAFWYKRKQDAEEATLRVLKKEQRDKVEELKKKTGYYSTRNLLEKYDEAIKKNEETRKPLSGSSTPIAASTPSRTKSKPISSSNPNSPQIPGSGFDSPSTLSFPPPSNVPLLPPAPSGPIHRTLIDKLADALLGVSGDEGGPNNKYALICGQCFAHNGLVLKEEFDTIKYQCPRCGWMNQSRNPPPLRQIRAASVIEGNRSNHRRRVQSMHLPARVQPQGDQDETEEEEEEEEQEEETATEPKREIELDSMEVDD